MSPEQDEESPTTVRLRQAAIVVEILLNLLICAQVLDMMEHGTLSGQLSQKWENLKKKVKAWRSFENQRRYVLWQAEQTLREVTRG
jgi:hypothetical protein